MKNIKLEKGALESENPNMSVHPHWILPVNKLTLGELYNSLSFKFATKTN